MVRKTGIWKFVRRVVKFHSRSFDSFREKSEFQLPCVDQYADRLSNEEIGSLMGRTESSIKSLYFRTLKALKADLEARGW